MNTGDGFRRVVSGAPMAISAEAWNDLTALALERRQHRHDTGGVASEPARQAGIVLVRNLTGAGLDRFAVLALGDPIITPSENSLQFQSEPTFDGSTPSIGTPAGRFAVLLDPVPADGIGRAVVSGVTPVRLLVSGSLEAFASHTAGSTAALTSSATGSARVLWAESSGSPRWALVRLGDGSVSAGGGGLTLSEVDGSPSLTSVVEVRLDQAWGFSLFSVSPGVALLQLLAASTTQTGVVTTDSQQFVGVKDFTTSARVGGPLVVYDLAGASGYGEYNTVEWNQSEADHTDTGSGAPYASESPGNWRAVATLASSVYRWNLGQTNTDGHAPGVGGVGSSGLGLYVEISVGADGVRLVLCGDDGSSGPPRYAVYDAGNDTVYTGVTGTSGGGDTVKGGIITSAGTGPTEIDGGTF